MNGGKSKGYTDTWSCAEKRLSLTSYLLVSILSSETHANMKHSSSQKMIKKKRWAHAYNIRIATKLLKNYGKCNKAE